MQTSIVRQVSGTVTRLITIGLGLVLAGLVLLGFPSISLGNEFPTDFERVAAGGGGDHSLNGLEAEGDGGLVGQGTITVCLSGPTDGGIAEGESWGPHKVVVCSGSPTPTTDITVNVHFTIRNDVTGVPTSVVIPAGSRESETWTTETIRDNLVERTERMVLTLSSDSPGVVVTSGVFRQRQILLNSHDGARLSVVETNISTLSDPDSAIGIFSEDVTNGTIQTLLVEEEEPVVTISVRISKSVDGPLSFGWDIGHKVRVGNLSVFRPLDDWDDDFYDLPDSSLMIPANSPAGHTVDLVLSVKDDMLDEELEAPMIYFYDPVSSFGSDISWQRPQERQRIFAIGPSDLDNIVERDTVVSGLEAVVGDVGGGSLDRSVTVSWSGVSDEFGVHRYVMEAVPAPPVGSSPDWRNVGLVSDSVWGVDSRSGVLSGLVGDKDYVVRVAPSSNLDYNRSYGGDSVSFRTGDPPVLSIDDAVPLVLDEGGSVVVEVGLDYGLLRTAEVGEDDPNDVGFRVVPFVGEEDSLSAGELPDAVEGTVLAGDTTGSVMLVMADDVLVEGDEGFSVRLEPVVGVGEVPWFSLGDPVGVTVVDDDVGPVTVSVSGGFLSQGVDGLVEGGSNDELWAGFTVSWSEALGSSFLVDWRLGDGVDLGQISLIEDGGGGEVGLAESGVLEIGAGVVSDSLWFRLADDGLAEGLGEFSVVFSNLRFVESRVRSGGGFPVGFVGGVSELSASVVVEASDQGALTVPAGGFGGVDVDVVLWVGGDRLGRDADRMVTVHWSDTGLAMSGRTGYRIEWGVYDAVSSSFDPVASESVVVSDPGLRAISLGGLDPGGVYRVEVTELLGGTDGAQINFAEVRTAAALSAGWADSDGMLELAEGGSFGLGVSLSGGGRAVPVDFGFAVVGDGADDLVVADLEGEVRIGAGLLEGSLANQIGVVDDDIVEGNETIEIGMVAGSPFVPGVGFADPYRVTVTDDDVASLSLSVSDLVVWEDRVGGVGDANSFVVEVSLDKVVASPVTVNLAMSGVDAADLVGGLTASVAIPAGEISALVPVVVADDDLTEVAETVVVAISSESVTLAGRDDDPVLFNATDTVSVTIQPSDVAVPSVSAVTATAGVALGGVRVDTHERIDVSWTPPSDVGGVSGYVARFVPVPSDGSEPVEEGWLFGGEVSDPAATSMLIEGHLGLEAGGSFWVEVSARVWGVQSGFDWVRVSQPVVLAVGVPEVSLMAVSGAEGEVVVVAVSLSSAVSWDVGLSVSSVEGSAASFVDFVPVFSERVVIPGGQVSSRFEVGLLDDDVVEGVETFTVGIVQGSVVGGVGIADVDNTVLVTITDDDVATVSVSSEFADSVVAEDIAVGSMATPIEYVFSLDREVTADLLVGWRVVTDSDVTATDIVGAVMGTVSIPAGELSGSVSLMVADDSSAENEELLVLEISTVSVMLEGRASPVGVSADSSSVSVILAASDQPVSAGEVSSVRITAGDGDGYDQDRALTVWWDVPSDTAGLTGFEVQFALVEETLNWVSAATVTSLTDTSYSFRPNRLEPSVVLSEGQQYVARVRSLKSGMNGDWVEAVSLPAVVAAPLTVSLVTDSFTVVEEWAEYLITVGLSGPYSHRINAVSNLNLTYTLNDATQWQRDVQKFSVSFFDEPGLLTVSERFFVVENSRLDDVRSVSISLTEGFRLFGSKLISVGNLVRDDLPFVLEDKTITVTIVDDDVAALESVSVSTTDSDGVALGDRRLQVSWELPTDLPEWYENSGYVVQYGRVVNGILGWSDDIVVDGGDSAEFTVELPTNLMAGEYKVRVKAIRGEFSSGWVESVESVTVDAPVSVSLVEGEVVGREGGSLVVGGCSRVGLVVSEELTVPVRFGLSEMGGSELSGPVVGTIPAGVGGWEGRVCVADDEVVEGEEMANVGLSVLSDGVVVGEVGSVPLRIVDDDRSLVSLSTSTPSVVEDVVVGGGASNEVSLEVGLSKVLSQDVVVGLVFSGDGIGSGDLSSSDVMFSGLEASVTVPAGESSVMVVVEVADDDIAEPTQILSVEMSGLSFPDGGFGEGVVSVDTGGARVGVSIASSDGYAVGVSASLPGANTEVAEDVDGGTESVVSYVVSLDSMVDVEVSVDFVVEKVSGSFTASDVVVTPASPLVIAVGDTSGTVEVRVVDDSFREEAEEFQIRLVSVSGSPSDGSSVDITGPLGPTITISASDPDSASVEPGEPAQTNPGGMSPDTGNGGSGSQPTQPPSGGAGGGQTPTTSPPANQGGQTNQGNANQGGQPGQPAQPPDTSGGNGQSQTPATNPPTNPGSQPTTGAPTNPGGQPTGSPTSPGSQPTTGVPVNPGGQPNAGGVGGVPPVVVVQPVAGDAVSGTMFVDTVGNTHESNIGMLADLGITRGCNPPSNTRYCPDRAVTRGEMATFMVRAFDLSETSANLFGDDDGNTHESNINRLATAEITRGCNPPTNSRYCPDRPVTRAQMATFIARALDLAEGSGDFTDTADSVHSNDINRIATVGITRGCNPPENSRYCPDRPVTRAEMATFLIRAQNLS